MSAAPMASDELRHLPRGIAVAAAALLGFALVMAVAANWGTLSRTGQFGLLQAGLVLSCGAAAFSPAAAAWRAPAALLGLLCIGGLFAFFGQTYQTGADPWQLFALWAALGLGLAVAARSDVVWAPWVLIAVVGVALWVQVHAHAFLALDALDAGPHALGLLALAALGLAVSPALARWTGAGLWAYRLAALLAVVLVSAVAVAALSRSDIRPQYLMGLLGLALAAGAVAATRRGFDVGVLSALALGIDTLLVCGLGTVMLRADIGGAADVIMLLLVLGLAAAGLLTVTVKAILGLHRRYALDEVQA